MAGISFASDCCGGDIPIYCRWHCDCGCDLYYCANCYYEHWHDIAMILRKYYGLNQIHNLINGEKMLKKLEHQ